MNSMMTKFEAKEAPMKSRFATSVIFLGMLTAPLYAQTVSWSVDSSSSSPAILFWSSVLVIIGFFLYPFIRANRALKREEDRLRRRDPNETGTGLYSYFFVFFTMGVLLLY